MSTRTIEVASIPLKPGLDLATGAAKTAWQASLATTARQQGARAVFWGYEVEHPGNIQMVVGACDALWLPTMRSTPTVRT